MSTSAPTRPDIRSANTGQTGALNESYADITGSLIEAKVENKAKDDPTRWTIGEESTAPPVRDMRTSATYKEDADVHDNSLVFSNAAYLMMTDTRTKDISDDQWAAVYYASMQVLPQNATFADARAAVEFAARNEDFTDEQLAAVGGELLGGQRRAARAGARRSPTAGWR